MADDHKALLWLVMAPLLPSLDLSAPAPTGLAACVAPAASEAVRGDPADFPADAGGAVERAAPASPEGVARSALPLARFVPPPRRPAKPPQIERAGRPPEGSPPRDQRFGASRSESRSLNELARATGLRGRTRKMGSAAERARSAVSWRIRSAIKKIGAAHPRLGQHLSNSIRTGNFCVYSPESATGWEL